MNISIPSILLSLVGKCLFSWALLFLQRGHICSSFVGVFSISLTVMDTALTLVVAAIHLHSDGQFFLLGLHVTRYHLCLLVQIVGQTYSTLQWPVVLVAALDHFCTVSQRLRFATTGLKWIVRSFVTISVWCLSALYIFMLSDFIPILEDVSHHQIHQCWIFHNFQVLQVTILLFLTLGCSALHAGCSTQILKYLIVRDQITDSRRSIVSQGLRIFLNTWATVLVFLAVFLFLPVGLPSYIDLNVAWLCFLNSFLIGAVLCVVCPATQLAQGLAAVPPDSFCEWSFKFILAAENRT